jgi:hypothetical protein
VAYVLVSGLFFTLAVGYWLLAVSRLEDGKLNSRGFSNPWKASRFNYRTVCKDGDFNTEGLSSPRTRCRSASFQTPFSILSFIFPRVQEPAAIRLRLRVLSDALSLCVIFDGWADLICVLCLMFSFWFALRCFANGQWLTANGCCFVVRNNTAKIHIYFVITK